LIRTALLAALAALSLASAAAAQERPDTTARDSSDVLILTHDFTGPGEFARGTMLKGEVYRAELSTVDAEIEVRPLRGGPPVFVYRDENAGPSGRGIFLIHPVATAEYQFRLISGGPVVSLNVYRDLKRSVKRQKVISEPGWEIGAEAGVGFHSGYKLNTADAAIDDSDDGGINIEGCFSARSGPGILRGVSGCAFGIGYDARPGSKSVVWFFLEPRVRIIGGRPRGESNTEVGVLGRASYGLVGGINRNPKMLSIGAYASRNIRWNKEGKGISFTLAYRYSGINGLGYDENGREFKAPTNSRVTFSIGYYQ
jgi:hypothetical protein